MNIKSRIKIKCKQCGAFNLVIPSVAKTKIYCNKACAIKAGIYGAKKKLDKDKISWLRRKEELCKIKEYVRGLIIWDEDCVVF